MSQFAYTMSGGKTRVMTFQVGEAMATAGVPILQAASASGATLGATTTTADTLGITLDTATYSTTQGIGVAQYVHVVANADAVWQCRLSGAATSGSALIPYFNTAASTTGLIVTPSATSGGAAVDMQAVTDGIIFGYSGANAGIGRRMLAADATNVDVVLPFDYDIAVDDQFIICPMSPGVPGVNYATLTTTLDELDSLVATAANTTANWRGVETVLNDIGNNGLLNSYINLIAYDHAFAGSALA